jgi:uncharacterized protein YndB with AHSA1/START domain
MLSFEWNAPPRFGELRNQRTRVILVFHELGDGRTQVDLAHAGWGQGAQWDELYNYFERAWSVVLDRLVKHMASADRKPIDNPAAAYRVIDRQVILPAGRSEVWKLYTSEQGLMSWMAPGAKVELKPGGAYELYFRPEAAPGSRGMEGTTVLTYLEPEIFAYRGSAPAQYPNVRKNGPCAVHFFDDPGDGQTRLRSYYVGWPTRDPEWDAAYEHGVVAADYVVERLKARFESGPVEWSKQPSHGAKPAAAPR